MRKFGMMPLPDRLRMSGLAEIAGYDTAPEARRTRAFIAGFTGLFPQLRKCLEAAGEVRPFCCLRPVTPHGPPILGRLAFCQSLLQRGPGHLGWTLAHGSAKVVAALVAGRDPGIDLTASDRRRACSAAAPLIRVPHLQLNLGMRERQRCSHLTSARAGGRR